MVRFPKTKPGPDEIESGPDFQGRLLFGEEFGCEIEDSLCIKIALVGFNPLLADRLSQFVESGSLLWGEGNLGNVGFVLGGLEPGRGVLLSRD